MDFPQQHEVLFPGNPFHVAHEPRNVAGNRQPNEGREDVPPPPVENVAAQGQPQGLQNVDMDNYDVANDYPPPQEHRDHIIADNLNARIVQDVPAQAHVAPPAPVCTDLSLPPYTYLTIPFTTCKGYCRI
jgi:hypothetical protein